MVADFPILTLDLGLELTFLPLNKRTHEWRDLDEARKVAAAFNRALGRLRRHDDTGNMVAKADPFRSLVCMDEQPYESWCVEVNGRALVGKYDWAPSVVASVYNIAAKLGLAPKVIKRRHDGSILEHPSGGGHLHLPTASLWPESSRFLMKLWLWERALCMDYVNNPIIRWAFAQWFDDTNSRATFDTKDFRTIRRRQSSKTPVSNATLSEFAHEWVFRQHGIKQRLAGMGKASFATYEFRFFDMARTPAEWGLQAQFLTHWASYHRNRVEWTVENLAAPESAAVLDYAPLTVGSEEYRKLRTSKTYARNRLRLFWERIGLEWTPEYDDLCWRQHYAPRMAGGKFV